MSKTISESDTLTMRTEPLEDGREKWDGDALDYRLWRFGLKVQENMEGYTVVFASSGPRHSFVQQIAMEYLRTFAIAPGGSQIAGTSRLSV